MAVYNLDELTDFLEFATAVAVIAVFVVYPLYLLYKCFGFQGSNLGECFYCTITCLLFGWQCGCSVIGSGDIAKEGQSQVNPGLLVNFQG